MKGFSFPFDLPMMLLTIKQIHATRKKLRKWTLQELMEAFTPSDRLGESNDYQVDDLVKTYRLISWYYRRVLKENNPCFVRSLILYDRAKRAGFDVQLIVGFRKSDKIKGHAWILLNGELFCDQKSFIQRYTEILSW